MAGRIGTAVRIHMNPKPKHIHESRPILDALKKFGEVNTFKNLRFDFNRVKPNSVNRCVRVIFDDKEAAERAIAASPLKLSISQPQPTHSSSPSTSPSPSSEHSSKWNPETILNRRGPNHTPDSEIQEITCTIEPDRHTEAMISPHLKFNVYNTRKNDNLILKDLESPETNIPLPQLADTIRREGVKLYDKRRKPDPNASTLMELYREGVKSAADARNWRTKIVTLDETSKSRQVGTRKSELRKLAKRKTDSQVEVED